MQECPDSLWVHQYSEYLPAMLCAVSYIKDFGRLRGIANYTVFKNGWVEVPRQQGHFVVADLFETLEVISSMTTRTEVGLETLVYSPCNHLTRLLTREYFIELSCRESFKV